MAPARRRRRGSARRRRPPGACAWSSGGSRNARPWPLHCRRDRRRCCPSSLEPVDDPHPVSAKDLLRWSEALSGIARTGLGFTQSLYERERFEEVLKVAADIRVASGHELEAEVLVQEWLKHVGE